MGIIMAILFVIIILVDKSVKYEDRKDSQRRAEANGEKLYRDVNGAWWYEDTRCFEYYLNGHDVIVPLNDRTHVLRDLTQEKIDKFNVEIRRQIQGIENARIKAKGEGKKYSEVHGFCVAHDLYCETDTKRIYTVVKQSWDGTYKKIYYNIMWPWGSSLGNNIEYECTEIKNLESEEEARLWGYPVELCTIRKKYYGCVLDSKLFRAYRIYEKNQEMREENVNE